MKLSIALATAVSMTGFLTAGTEKANAEVYCQYVRYPVNCVASTEVVLRPRPVAGAVAREARPGTPINRGGPVDRAGRR